ncbi:hypothetical protein DAEQUDRAFT_314961 [Daedalea quercina L-15889]|uniref:F-box domain-containing protein n=1 Tax=Daedalea quercina L-15889 TaxID=1314783 RepID=A0A165PVJ2_9APHY|nr:hypothetical protein DAEQUDRAFT_314961 [Daedalea quercina L-15889]
MEDWPSGYSESAANARQSLPPEVWDMIVFHLRKHRGALIACCLTCRAWLPTSRHYLLRHVRLTKKSSYNRFVEALDYAPELPAWVDKLTIKRNRRLSTRPFDISPVLLRLSGISHLHLDVAEHVTVSPLLNTVYPSLSTIILNVGTYRGHDIARLFSLCPRLVSLRLVSVYGDHDDPPSTVDSTQPGITNSSDTCIKDLVLLITSSSIVYHLLHSPIRFELQSLEIDGHLFASTPCPRILWDSQSVLRSLVLRHSTWRERSDLNAVQETIGSLRLSALRSLSFEPVATPWLSTADHIVDFLNVINTDCIDDIRLALCTPAHNTPYDFSHVDQTLASFARPALRITIIIEFDGYTISGRHDLASSILSGYPQLRARGSRVQVVVTDKFGRFPKETFHS